MGDMATSMASLALDDGEEELLQVDGEASLSSFSVVNFLADIVFHWDLSLRAPDRRPQPENRWLREETDGHVPRSQESGKSGGISFPNLSDNYGKNFRNDHMGDSSLLAKSTGDASGRPSSQMDFQMGLASEDSLMV
ncbi:hypothetical protein V6N11_007158 [Hibiscus sabdariffa]|uniref:Uncharacterized protein n=1 Tax=Hibiscus sabdariffa TaxID=183260 RepID=A0ABR2RSY0_9ROSI